MEKNYMNRNKDFNTLEKLQNIIKNKKLPIEIEIHRDVDTGEFIRAIVNNSIYTDTRKLICAVALQIVRYDTDVLRKMMVAIYNIDLDWGGFND
jgi:hypothetical protein